MTTIADLVAWIETKNERGAIRFEPGTYNKFWGDALKANKVAQAILARIREVNACSIHTAAMIYSTSWGAYQLMGFNLYADAQGAMPVSEYLVSPTAQAASLAAFLARVGLSNVTPEQLARGQALRLKFAMRYNGAIAYEQAMIEALKHFGFSVSN
jgi:hypothetical protein